MATDEAFFVAQSTTGLGKALWVTDGTASGTRQIQAANTGIAGLNPDSLAVSATGTRTTAPSTVAGPVPTAPSGPVTVTSAPSTVPPKVRVTAAGAAVTVLSAAGSVDSSTVCADAGAGAAST